ncbi:MAG: alpha/beta fold hydrolase [Acidobacteria bacterium]|nr:alpha/beta fold hydrolase [Acidobacteriota bacterium]
MSARTRDWWRALNLAAAFTVIAVLPVLGQAAGQAEAPPKAPADVKPGSITYEDIAYPYPVSYLPLTLYGQDVRMAYMDVAPAGQPNGRTVVLFHGMNFGGFYFGGPIEALRNEGFRVVVPDQIGFGRSSKPIIPYNFHDMALNTRKLLQSLGVTPSYDVGPDGRLLMLKRSGGQVQPVIVHNWGRELREKTAPKK